MTGPTNLEAALELHDLGLAVLPAVADDGKSVAGVMKGFQKWNRRLPRCKVEALFAKHPTGCIALLVGHSGLVVVDCDDETALTVAEARFGHTPILVRTPGGQRGHLYYRVPREPVRAANLRRSEGLAIDIKAGKGAYVIAPPSRRPSTDIPYRFERGSWADLPNLPIFRHQADSPTVQIRKSVREAKSMPISGAQSRLHEEGDRNNRLFKRALRLAPDCQTQSDLQLKVRVANEAECSPPLPWEEVDKIAASAWGYEVSGHNRVGREPHLNVPKSRLERLKDKPDAFLLDSLMRFNHDGLRPQFYASPKAMAAHNVLPGWPAARYSRAIRVLVDRQVWTVLKKGGRGAHDPYEYGFADCSLQAQKGTEFEPNTNQTPPFPLSSAGAREAA